MTSYTVHVIREDPWWVAVIDGLPGGATETRRLANLEHQVRDLIAGLLDVDPADPVLSWEWAASAPG